MQFLNEIDYNEIETREIEDLKSNINKLSYSFN